MFMSEEKSSDIDSNAYGQIYLIKQAARNHACIKYLTEK